MSRSFDGVDDDGDVGAGSSIANIDPVTIVIWARLQSVGEGGNGRFFEKDGKWTIFTTGTDRITWQRVYAGVLTRTTNDNAFTDNVWLRLAITGNGPLATDVHTYLNGVEATYAITTDSSGALSDDSAANFLFGNRPAADRTLAGQLAFSQMFNRVLSIGEINQAHRIPGSITNGLIMFHAFVGSSDPEPDYSGNGNSGAITGAIKGTTEPPINGLYFPRGFSRHAYVVPAAAAVAAVVVGRRRLKTLLGVGL